MTRDEIKAIIRKAITDETGLPNSFNENVPLVDLGVKDESIIFVAMNIEDNIDVPLSGEVADESIGDLTINTLADYIEENLK